MVAQALHGWASVVVSCAVSSSVTFTFMRFVENDGQGDFFLSLE